MSALATKSVDHSIIDEDPAIANLNACGGDALMALRSVIATLNICSNSLNWHLISIALESLVVGSRHSPVMSDGNETPKGHRSSPL